MDVLTILEEHGLPDEDICLIVHNDVALLSLFLTLVYFLNEACNEVHVERVLRPDNEPIALVAEIIE